MLPPIEPTVLRENPQFASLYKKLTTTVLNPDGSIKPSPEEAKSRSKLEEDLRVAQTEAAKAQLIRTTLPRLSYGGNELPEELQEVVQIVAAQLTSDLSNADKDLLSEDVSYFLNHLKLIGSALSSELSSTASHLARIANPDPQSNPSTLLTQIPQLSLSLQTRREALLRSQEALSLARVELAAMAAAVLEASRELIEAAIRTLELTKYGSVARGVRAQAEHLAMVAEGMDAKLQVTKLEALHEIYTPEVRTALERYKEHLEDTRIRLGRRERDARGRLQGYDRAGKEMGEISRRYGQLRREVETVKADIRRLGGEV